MAKYPYIVNKNGVWYPSGSEVPDGETIRDKEYKPKQDDFPQYMNQQEEVKSEKIVLNDGYTKTEINRMSTADLKKLAKGNGIDESLSGSEIKKALIDKFGL